MNTEYLIKIDDNLHGYNNPQLLYLDILQNKPEVVELYQVVQSALTVTYKRIALADLKIESEKYSA